MKSIKEFFSKQEIKSNLKIIFFALIAAILFRSFLYEPFYIPSGSMKSTLLEGDIVAVSKFKYGFSIILLYVISSIYHGLKANSTAKKVFQILDHCSIFLLIAVLIFFKESSIASISSLRSCTLP